MKLKSLPILAVAVAFAAIVPTASSQTAPSEGNQIPILQARLGQISQNARGAAAVNAIVAAYRATVRQNPAQAAVLLRVANRRLNQFILPSQRGAIALSLSQATAAAFIQAGITAESPLYLQTFPFIATTIPSDQRTASLLNQIAQTASFANERVGGNSVADIPVTDAIFGSAGVTPPPVS